MIILWTSMGLLLLLTAVSVLLPLYRRSANASKPSSTGSAFDREEANLQVFEDRMAEIQREAEAGRLTASERSALELELKRSLVADTSDTESKPVVAGGSQPGQRRLLTLTLALVLPIFACLFYLQNDSYHRTDEHLFMDGLQAEIAQSGDISGAIEVVERAVERRPDHIGAWFLLGRAHMRAEQFVAAAQAFGQAAEQARSQGENPALAYGLQAQALFLKEETISPAVEVAIRAALEAYPEEGNALSIRGIAAFKDGRYEAAIEDWKRALKSETGGNAEALRAGISRARQLLARDSVAGSEGPSRNAEISIELSLSESARSELDPDTAIFVLAREAGGNPMPLAVQRVQASDLPMRMMLDSTMAMTPERSLADAESVEIIARASRSGNPRPQPGDWEGKTGPRAWLQDTSPDGGDPAPRSMAVEVVIDQRL